MADLTPDQPRLPDPTLSAYRASGEVGCAAVMLDGWSGAEPSVAHRLRRTRSQGDLSECGAPVAFWASTEDACWFAVPCRECFPDAPPPGCQPMPERGPGFWRTDPGLAWQLQEADQR